MQVKITAHLILITCWIVSLRAKALYPKGCYECEEEIWEEVPCEEIPSNSTTVSVPHSTTPSYKLTTPTQNPLTTKTTTPHTPTTIKFSTTTRPTAKNGRLESTHILQREFLPNSNYKSENPSDYKPSYNHLSYEASTPTPSKSVLEPKYNGNKFIESGHYRNYNKPALTSVHYYSKPASALVGDPIYHSAKGRDKSYANIEEYEIPYYSHQPSPPVPPSSQSQYGISNPNSYDFSLPFENAYSGILKSGNSIDFIDAPKYKPKDMNLQHYQ
ncbi:hypothetical protein DOY81_012401 [Sarcophaga bullata]|nr:hypothetical protein DOY81_012401 [Sarcophaga bullata]